jgi:hypothetical protein
MVVIFSILRFGMEACSFEISLAYERGKRLHTGVWKVTNAELHKFDKPMINKQPPERHGRLKRFHSAEAVLSEYLKIGHYPIPIFERVDQR